MSSARRCDLTVIALKLAEAGNNQLSLFDVLGRRAAVLHEGPHSSGTHRFTERLAVVR